MEFVQIDVNFRTDSYDCTNSEYESSVDICGCTGSVKQELVGGSECDDIV